MAESNPLHNQGRHDSEPRRRPPAADNDDSWRGRGRLPAAAGVASDGSLTESTVGQTWLLIAGIVLMLFGLGYFLKYSFDQNWINPLARVMLAYVAGLFTVSLGGWLQSGRLKTFGLFLIGGGVGMLYFATYAAFGFYGFLGQPTAFGLMVAITAGAVWLAVRFDTPWLAILAQFGGFLTPVILSTGVDNQTALMTYLVILNLGLLTIALFKQWTSLNFLGFIFTWVLFLAWMGRHYDVSKLAPTVAFLSVFFLTYALIPYVYFFIRRREGDLKGFWITLPNTLIALGCIVGICGGAGLLRLAGLFCLSYAAVFVLLALDLRRRSGENRLPVTLMILQALLLTTVGLSLALEGGFLTLALAGLAVATLLIATRERQVLLFGSAAVLLIGATLKLVIHDYPNVFQFNGELWGYLRGFEPGLLPRWLAVMGVIAATYGCGQILYRTRDRLYPELQSLGRSLGVFAVLELFVALNLETAAWLQAMGPQAQLAGISVLWTLFGVALMAAGFRARLQALRVTAMTLFVVTLVKLFLFDMAHVETPYRILSFGAVGVLLIGASFLYHRFADRLLPAAETAAEDALPAEAENLQEQPGWDEAAQQV